MMTYDVFLSHGSADEPAVETLAGRLRDEGLRVFFPRWELVPGAHWQEALEKGLADSRTCAVFVGPQGIGPWHTAEMRVALDQRVEKEPKRVIPVLLPGASPDAIPSFLAQRTWVDFRGGLDNESAFAQLVAGVRGLAPGGGNAATSFGNVEAAPGRDDGPSASKGSAWWRRSRVHLAVGIVGVVLTTLAWVWQRQPTVPPPLEPARPDIYYLRVQVLDPDGNPVREESTVITSAGNESQPLRDGWWQLEIVSAKVPRDGKVTIWAEHPDWVSGWAEIELTDDTNPRAEVRLKTPESRISGVVRDATNRAVVNARITVTNRVAEPAVTDWDGRFELALEVVQGRTVRLHVEHPDFPAEDQFCYTGSDACAVTLTAP